MTPNLIVPRNILKQHLVALGKTGSGKSSVLRHLVEYLLGQNKRVCIIDIKGDWHGLKSSADGKSAGFKVIGFGDFKDPKATDIPINAKSGQMVAELIASGNRPCLIGFRGWTVGDRTRFWIDFAQALYACKNLGELYLVGDEFHNLAPKGKILSPEAGLCLHWSNTLLSEGRGLGLICLLATQRPQKLHNDALTQCETLVAMRVIHAADRQAVKDWIDGCGDDNHGKIVLDALAGLPRGSAYIWSPEVGFGPKRVDFPMFTTFDSFAPPQLQKQVSDSGWADVDLAEVRQKMAAVIEEHKAKDPTELRKQLAEEKRRGNELAKQLETATKLTPSVVTKASVKEIPALTAHERSRLTKMIESFDRLYTRAEQGYGELLAVGKATNDLQAEVRFFRELLAKRMTTIVAGRSVGKTLTVLPGTGMPPLSRPAREQLINNIPKYSGSPPTPTTADDKLPPGEVAVLSACIQYPDGVERTRLSVLTGYAKSSRDAYIYRLREKGLVTVQGDTIIATDDGRAALPNAQPLPTGEALQEFHRQRLPEGERKIFELLLAAYPASVVKTDIDECTGYAKSSRDAYLYRMRAKMIITEPDRGLVRAADSLFT